MTLQLLEEGRRQAWAAGALLDCIRCSTKLFGRRNLAEAGFVSTTELMFFQKSDIWNNQATRELQPKMNTKQSNKIIIL